MAISEELDELIGFLSSPSSSYQVIVSEMNELSFVNIPHYLSNFNRAEKSFSFCFVVSHDFYQLIPFYEKSTLPIQFPLCRIRVQKRKILFLFFIHGKLMYSFLS